METTSEYLKKLKFDPKLLLSWVAAYLVNLRFLTLIVLGIIAFGIQSYFALPRTLNPEIKIPIVIVSTVLPGAGPTDIESLITVPIEDVVRGVDGVKKVTSTSRDSASIVQIEFQSGYDADKAKSDVQSAVDSVSDLPEDALDPNIQKLDFENQPIWTFSLAGAQDRGSLIRFSRDLKKELEDLASIDKVEITGLDEQEIQIVIKPAAISTYGINPQALMGAIKSGISSFPAGNVKTADSTFSLSIDPAVTTVDELRETKINLNNQVVALSDISEVREISKPDQNESYILHDGQASSSVTFSVFRLSGVNFDVADKEAQEKVNEKIAQAGNGFKVMTILNTSEQIGESFHDLQRDITLVITLVFIVLFLFLGIRQAFVSMLSIPLTFLITFIVMSMTGIALSFLATFSLLLSLGLLVDDAIVIISAMTAYYRSGRFTPLETGLLVWKDFWVAILTTTITTVWAFIPLLLSSGIIGEFIKPIPIIVSATLIGSIFVALFIILPLMVFLLKPRLPFRVQVLVRILLVGVILGGFYFVIPKGVLFVPQLVVLAIFVLIVYLIRDAIVAFFTKRFLSREGSKERFNQIIDHGVISFGGVERSYNRLIHRILVSKSARRNTIIMVVIFSIFSYALVPAGLVKSEFFPGSDEDTVYVSAEMPAGTNLKVSRQEALVLLDRFKDIPDMEIVSLETGRTFGADFGGPSAGGSNTFLYSIALHKERSHTSSEVAQSLRNTFADYTKGKISVQEVSGGPPAGADLQIKLFGPDLKSLDDYANKVQDYLASQQGVNNISKSIKLGTSKLSFVPDRVKLAQNNISLDQLGFWLRLYASGFKADELKFSGDQDLTEDVTIRLGSSTQTVEDITAIIIPTQSGNVPLSSLGKMELTTNPTLITREDGKRTISVSAGVQTGYVVADLNKNLEKYADSLQLPSGYGWATGGANEENQKSVQSILNAMVLSFLLIIITMVLQFKSFRRAIIVMLVIPLSISGVFIIFAMAQIPLSFPALIGILALFGIVVKNSILIVDKILINQESGMDFSESVADAAASRLEPIALTSVCTIAGLIPITIADPLWRGLGGAIIAGLTFSGTIMLFFIPVVYYLIFNPKNAASKVVSSTIKVTKSKKGSK
jgi:multidrug efflux pump subunit AcrB